MEPLYSRHLGTKKGCPDNQDVLISEVKDILWQSMENHLVPLYYVHVSSIERCLHEIKGAGLEGSTVSTAHSVPV